MKKILFILFILLLAASFVTWRLFSFMSYKSPETVTLYFKPGTSLGQMSQALDEKDVVPDARFFRLMARLQGNDRKVKAGEYEFEKGLTPSQTLRKIVSGDVKYYPLTIPEGYNLNLIGGLVVGRGLTTMEKWNRLVRDPTLIQSLGIQAETLEGYLYPDTYLLPKQANAADLVRQMVTLFKNKVTPAMMQEAQAKGFDLHRWVTLASIVEKETGVPQERPMIAALFMTRLEKGMLLQTDPTVIYGVTNFNGNLTKQHLLTDTPYNTYTRAGLPPGPICSPGLGSLQAVLNPAPTEYLYFVSRGDGTHHFSRTLQEHNEAVRFYQLKRGMAPRAQPMTPPPQ